MSRGHHMAHMYRYGFFRTAIKVAIEDHGLAIVDMAMGNRIAQLDGKGFTKQIDILSPRPEASHAENLKRFGKE